MFRNESEWTIANYFANDSITCYLISMAYTVENQLIRLHKKTHKYDKYDQCIIRFSYEGEMLDKYLNFFIENPGFRIRTFLLKWLLFYVICMTVRMFLTENNHWPIKKFPDLQLVLTEMQYYQLSGTECTSFENTIQRNECQT